LTSQETALADLERALTEARLPYMLIGGLANVVSGEPRATLAIDVTVWALEPQVPAAIELLGRDFRILVEQPADFIDRTRVLPLESANGVRIDVIFGLLSFEQNAIARAMTVEMAGTLVKVCTTEDLILMKIVSDRERDLQDVQGIIRRRLGSLDRAYLEPRIRELSQLLERPEIESRWREWSGEGRL
jgi:predicted nucleotidyltransferase